MADQVSERLREALERLDLAIDRLEGRVGSEPSAKKTEGRPSTPAIAERLDRMIERLESALNA